jgi:hypothetical protein
LGLHGRLARAADRSGDFDQHHIRHNDRQRLVPQHLKELATDLMTRFTLVKGVHPDTGIDRVHRVTAASTALLPSKFLMLAYHWR